jgi:hypothetical protein
MATYTTYEQVGIKEDVSDIISNISPTKTPFQSAIGKSKATQTLFEWQEDSLRAVQSAPRAEGADAPAASATPTVMRQNRTQIFSDTVNVSGTADVVATYGRKRESAYQMYKVSAQLKRDLEHALVGTAQAAVSGDDTGPTARQMAGVQTQIIAGNVVHSGAATPLSEANVLSALQLAYTAGAEPNLAQVTPSNSLIFADFAKAAGRYRTIQQGGSDKTLTNVVDLYVSPFGTIKVQLNRFLRAANTLIVDPAQWELVTLRPWTKEPLAKTGDATKVMLVGEFSSKHKNYSASALVVDNAASDF